MNRAIAWFARNPVAANLLMLIIMVGGVLATTRLVYEVFPEIEAEVITITVPYPGSSPEEVEESICVRVEEAIHDVEGIERITSVASENKGVITAEVLYGYDMREVLDEIKSRVDNITTFPVESERPIIQQVTRKRQVVNLTLSGKADEITLKRLGEQMRDELASIPGITQVELSGVRDYEISIEVSEETLRRHGLTFDDVLKAVQRSSLDLPGGTIKTAGGEILVRTKGQAYRGADFRDIPVYSRTDGSVLYLSEIAQVVDGFSQTDRIVRFDGEPSVLLEVYRIGDQNVLDLAEKVHDYVQEAKMRLPEGLKIDVWRDRSVYYKSRLDLMVKNGVTGLILVVVLLSLFLRAKVAFWVSLGIPISFLGAIWFMPYLGASLNLMTMFAFILVLGIVVDDAIVVGENVYKHQQDSADGLASAIKGTQEVSVPVIFAVLTTVAAFIPLLRIPGHMGQVWRMLPMIVIPCLMFSLAESLLILPAHLSHLKPRCIEIRKARFCLSNMWHPVNDWVSRALHWFIRRIYRPVLEVCLRWRYLTVAVFIAMLVVTASFIPGGRLKMTFFPPIESAFARCTLEMRPGTPFEATAAAVKRIEMAALKLNQEYADKIPGNNKKMVQHIFAHATNNTGRVYLELLPSQERIGPGLSAAEVTARWFKLIGSIPDAVEISMRSSFGRANRPIDIQLTGQKISHLAQAAEKLKAQLRSYPGVIEVLDSFREGKQEIKLTLKPAAASLGLSVQDLARQVRQGFYGGEAQRIVRGRDEVKVMVRYPEAKRRSLGDLENMRIRTPQGTEVPISAVAQMTLGRGFESIQRANRHRVVNVSAKVDSTKANANEIVIEVKNDFLPRLLADTPGLTYSFEGQLREQDETLTALTYEFTVALFVIFALIAIPFKSYIQPLIVMSAIPFSIIGVVWGHLAMGLQLSVYSAMGCVALAGIVVNDSLVLVDYVNRSLSHGTSLQKTVRRAGEARFRAILLTSITTCAGLTPILLEQSRQAKFLQPMAASLGYGILFATFITLILVPASYLILEDIKNVAHRVKNWLRG